MRIANPFRSWGNKRRASNLAATLTQLAHPTSARKQILEPISQNTDVLAIPVRVGFGGPKLTTVEHFVDLEIESKLGDWAIADLVVLYEQVVFLWDNYEDELDVSRASNLDLLRRNVLYAFLGGFEQQMPGDLSSRMIWLADGWSLLAHVPVSWGGMLQNIRQVAVDSLASLYRVLSDETSTKRAAAVKLCCAHVGTAFLDEEIRLRVTRAIRWLPPEARQEAEILDTIAVLLAIAELNAEDDEGRKRNAADVVPALDHLTRVKLSVRADAAQAAAYQRLLSLMPGQAT